MPYASSPDRRGHSAVVGLQWGDEGKGKVADLLAAEHDVIVRYNGGANAGHTVVIDDERYALHLLPTGILSPEKTCVVANGVVIDPAKLLEEMEGLRARGIEVGANLRISDRAHVVMPWHHAYDAAFENVLATPGDADGEGDRAIGTTRRGIGPAYADKVYRATAIRVGDLLDANELRRKVAFIAPIQAERLAAMGIDDPIEPDAIVERFAAIGRALEPFVTDTTYLVHDEIRAGRRILFEGANACLLDVDHGTYPYVTSSHSSTLGIPAGSGVPFRELDRVLGVIKAYATRVGAGPFPTEQANDVGDRIRARGNEYGTTTGRPRRCGWLDVVAVRYSAMICGVTGLACMLLDVLSGFDELRICTGYRLPDGTVTDRFLPDARRLAAIEPVYETLPGWSEEIDDTTDRDQLPERALAYLERIETLVGVPVELVSVGPDRAQTLVTA